MESRLFKCIVWKFGPGRHCLPYWYMIVSTTAFLMVSIGGYTELEVLDSILFDLEQAFKIK